MDGGWCAFGPLLLFSFDWLFFRFGVSLVKKTQSDVETNSPNKKNIWSQRCFSQRRNYFH